jgi:hypothetical protein
MFDSTKVTFGAARDDGRVMQPSIHISAVCAAYLFWPRKVWELFSIGNANVVIALYVRNAINRKGDAVVDFEHQVCQHDEGKWEPDKGSGDTVAENNVSGTASGHKKHADTVSRKTSIDSGAL